MSERTWIVNGHVVCPTSGVDGAAAVEIAGGAIVAVHRGPVEPGLGDRVVDAAGAVVAPGLVDLHCRLGEPGEEHKEDLESGGRAGARGGFTTLCPAADTHPCNDSRSVTEHLVRRGAALRGPRIRPVAALSMGLAGKRLTEMYDLREAGAVAFGDGGRSVADPSLLRRGMEYAQAVGAPVFDGACDARLAGKGVMHEGPVATRLGLKGSPAAAEDVAVLRAIALAEETGARVHLGPVSTLGSVRALRAAKQLGLPVTAAVCVANLVLTDEAVARTWSTDLRLAPPLRPQAHLDAVLEALADGTIDAIASGHAPQGPAEKEVEFDLADPGMVALETALGLVMRLVEAGSLSLSDAVARLSSGPAAVLGVDAGSLQAGAPADVVVFDPRARHRVEATGLASRSHNTPFIGQALPGRVALTMVGGEVVYSAESGA